MQHLYFISQRRMTDSLVEAMTEGKRLVVFNELLRPQFDHPQEAAGDIVHKDFESAKRMAYDLLFDLGDKRMDVLTIDVDDSVFARLHESGDITTSARPDAFGAEMLWLSQAACKRVNDTMMRVRATPLTVDVPSGAGTDCAPRVVH